MKITKNDIFLAISVSAICVLAFILGRRSKADSVIYRQPTINVDTIFKERIDTTKVYIAVNKPIPTRTDTIYKTDTLTNEVVQDKIINVYEGNDSVVNQNDTLLPPMSVKYHWYVRNVNCDLDSLSIDIDVPQRTRMLKITKEVTKYKTKRWGLTVGVGVGYSPCMKVEPFVGVIWGYRF